MTTTIPSLPGYQGPGSSTYKAPYRCPACQVQGVGDECWHCGTNAIVRTGLSHTVNGQTQRY